MVRDGAARLLTMRGQSYFPIFSHIHRATLSGELVASFPAARRSDQETVSPTLILRSAQRARLEGWPHAPGPASSWFATALRASSP
jgi:hypothetical protein